MKQYVLLMDNFETLNEFCGVDTPDEQYVIQKCYHRFENMCEDGSSNWTKNELFGRILQMDLQLLPLRN